MTQASSVRCQHCGAALKINDGVRFVTCGYCQSELEIVRDASTVYTEVLTRLQENSDAMAGSIKIIEVQNEIERADREWKTWEEENLPLLASLRQQRRQKADQFKAEGGCLAIACVLAPLCGAVALSAFSGMVRASHKGLSTSDYMGSLLVFGGVTMLSLILMVAKGIPRLKGDQPESLPDPDKLYAEVADAYRSARALLVEQLTVLQTGELPASEANTPS